jgi:hypothetical protein
VSVAAGTGGGHRQFVRAKELCSRALEFSGFQALVVSCFWEWKSCGLGRCIASPQGASCVPLTINRSTSLTLRHTRGNFSHEVISRDFGWFRAYGFSRLSDFLKSQCHGFGRLPPRMVRESQLILAVWQPHDGAGRGPISLPETGISCYPGCTLSANRGFGFFKWD